MVADQAVVEGVTATWKGSGPEGRSTAPVK
jgi:hypothetical protein